MRYTRYNYKRGNKRRDKNNSNFGFLFLGIICIILAVVLGTMIRPLVFGDAYKSSEDAKKTNSIVSNEDKIDKNKEDKTKEDKEVVKNDKDKKENDDNKVIAKEETKDIYILQCGVYSKKESAEKVIDKIPEGFNKFIGGKSGEFKVIAGIYDDKKSKEKKEKLNEEGIDSVRIKLGFDSKDPNEVEIYSIVKGYIDILAKLEEKDVKSIKINDFKSWTEKIIVKNENEEVRNLKKHIKSLPDSLDKKEVYKSLDYIYNLLIKYRV